MSILVATLTEMGISFLFLFQITVSSRELASVALATSTAQTNASSSHTSEDLLRERMERDEVHIAELLKKQRDELQRDFSDLARKYVNICTKICFPFLNLFSLRFVHLSEEKKIRYAHFQIKKKYLWCEQL